MQKFPKTAEGLAKLEEELKQLKAEERPAVIRAISALRTGSLEVAPLQSYLSGSY